MDKTITIYKPSIRAGLNFARQRAAKQTGDGIAWLIEKTDNAHPGCSTGLCLGVKNCGGRANVLWTFPELALRFARKVDAEDAARVLVPVMDTMAVEHQWKD